MNKDIRKGIPNEKLSAERTKTVLKRLGKYIFIHKYLFAAAISFTLLSNQFSLLGPKYSGEAIDAITATGGVDFPTVWENVGKMLFCYLSSALLSYCLSVLMIHLSQKIIYTMRRELFEKLTSLPISYFDTHATGDIISRISYDIDTVNASLSHDLIQVMTSVYTVVGSLIFMWQISKPLILIFALTVPASFLLTSFRSKKVRPLFQRRSRKLGELNGYAEEMLSGVRTIQAYGRQDEINSSFNSKNKEAMDAYYSADYYGATLGPSVNFINNLSLSLVMIFGGFMYMYSASGALKTTSIFFITLGGIAEFVQYSRKFAGPINEFANMLHEFQSAFSAAERVFKVIDEDSEMPDSLDAEELTEIRGDVKLDNIIFGYTTEKTILKGISIDIKSGTKVAVVGPTGAGKTTLINLLMRFYDTNSGTISIDGVPINEITRKSLRKSFTMVLQDTWLFHGTIFENIAYGKDGATLDEVKKVAEDARIDSYIEHLTDGYNTVLSDDGTNISKGQKQLITIARAMLSDSPMLILDEATSNVDSRTEIKIGQAMEKLMYGRTSFIIAHRLSTVKNADLILVMQQGIITESGTHDELIALGGFYSTLYNSQFD